jgi:branched-chain amino acid transport system ATP-binding protein
MGSYTARIFRKNKAKIRESIANVFNRFKRLKGRKDQLAGTLSGGEQQMLAIDRVLMSKPKLILLDEPSMTPAPMLVWEIFSIIKEINQAGATIILVEQNAHMALSVAIGLTSWKPGKLSSGVQPRKWPITRK